MGNPQPDFAAAPHPAMTDQGRPAPAYRWDGAYALLVYLHAQTIRQAALDTPTPDFDAARLALREASEVMEGIERYRRHPFLRYAPAKPIVWSRGSVRLLDFGGKGPPVLVIPSLINGSQIMDLAPDLSPLRWMARQGFRVFKIDWGKPGVEERRFSLADYLEQRLIPALGAAARVTGEAVNLVGYCMGGPLTLALSRACPDQVRRVVTLGAPWEFSAFPEHDAMRERRGEVMQMLSSVEALFGVIPPQITQSFFAMRDLSSGATKFRRFAQLDPASAEAKRFVAVEDWLNDGVPLAPPVGRECFLEWITDNALARGKWSPGGAAFDASQIRHPALVVSAQRDTVVRRAASEPLADVLPDARLLKAPVGHIGMVVGAGALDAVWRPVHGFLSA